MPSQYEKLKSLFTEFGLGFDENRTPFTNADDMSFSTLKDGEKSIFCKEGKHNKVDGYNGFSSEFVFDKDGNFIQLNCLE